jgi:hypothetical protein
MIINTPVTVTEPCTNYLEIEDSDGNVICCFDCPENYIDGETRDRAKVVAHSINSMSRACEAQETLIGVIKAELAASELRYEELIALSLQLAERHVLNQN